MSSVRINDLPLKRVPDSTDDFEIQETLEGHSKRVMFQSIVPVGTMVLFGSPTIPDGWLLCNGEAMSREEFNPLYNIIGTKYGEGDGNTTFNLPKPTKGSDRIFNAYMII